MSILTIKNSQPTISSEIISSELGIEHRATLQLIKKHQSKIELFGQVAFEMLTVKNSVGAVNEKSICYLNENQAIFVGTLSKNTERAVQYKAVLTQAFSNYKNQIQPTAPQPANELDFLQGMLNSIKAQALKVKELETTTQNLTSQIQVLQETPRIVNLEMKNLTQLKGFKQIQKNEVGVSIKKLVEKIGKMHGFKVVLDTDFPTDMKKAKYFLNTGEEANAGEFFAKQHHFCHELYSAGAETYYSGADSATLEEKEQYRIWLNNYLAKNSSRLV